MAKLPLLVFASAVACSPLALAEETASQERTWTQETAEETREAGAAVGAETREAGRETTEEAREAAAEARAAGREAAQDAREAGAEAEAEAAEETREASASAREAGDEASDEASAAARTTSDRIDDSATTARVKTALITDDDARARNIDVETHDGVVQLSGFVESERAKQAAEEAASGVEGVAEVRNALIVEERERTAGAVVDDTVIAAKVKGELASEAGLGTATAVNVEVNNGVVQLSGFVDSENDKQRAEELANTVEGVAEVRNDIAIER